jgi:hypothetical protein
MSFFGDPTRFEDPARAQLEVLDALIDDVDDLVISVLLQPHPMDSRMLLIEYWLHDRKTVAGLIKLLAHDQ